MSGGSLVIPVFVLCCVVLGVLAIWKRRQIMARRKKGELVAAFFHPYCNDGGGGERVLWCSVQAVQVRYPNAQCVIYTGEEGSSSPEQILSKVKSHFNLHLPRDVKFFFLKKRWMVEDATWKRFTLIGQSIGSMALAWEALNHCTPNVCLDTMGYAFTYPVFRFFGGCKMGCYVHYPTISTDMLSVVSERRPSFNHDAAISSSLFRTGAKLIYYYMFAMLYRKMGSCSQVVMVNSTWTMGHIEAMWKVPTAVVYPPCNTTALQKIPLGVRQSLIVSVAQFRPEKDHMLQIDSMQKFFQKYPEWKGKVKLVLIGSSRNEGDAARVQALRQRRDLLRLQNDVDFKVNVSYEELKQWLSKASIGLHTMWNEHFGIGVVEFMAAGVIPVAHNSGGPKADIVVQYQGQPTGFLAATASEYAEQFHHILSMTQEERLAIQANARSSVDKFSDSKFATQFQDCIEPLFT